MDNKTLEKLKELSSQLLKDSYILCDHDDPAVGFVAVRINKNAYDLKKLLEKIETPKSE